MSKPTIGLVLGGGGARGWSHIGVIECLEASGIKPDIIAGCSMGALVGAAYAGGRMDALKTWALTSAWPATYFTMVDVSFSGGGLVGGARVREMLSGLGLGGDIGDLALPFGAVATDFETGREEWLQSGPVLTAVRASISIPGVFSPAKVGDRFLVDGGVVNPVPTSLCRAMGADVMIAVNLTSTMNAMRHLDRPTPESVDAWRREVEGSLSALPGGLRSGLARTAVDMFGPKPAQPGYFEVLINSFNIMQDRITRSRLAGEPAHVTLAPQLGSFTSLDYDKAGPIIEIGRQSAEAAMPAIRNLLESSSRP